MRSIVSTANGGRPPLALGAGACGAISDTSSAHGTTRFISSRNSRLRVRLVLRSYPLSPRLICFMSAMSHITRVAAGLCRPSLAPLEISDTLCFYSHGGEAPRTWGRYKMSDEIGGDALIWWGISGSMTLKERNC